MAMLTNVNGLSEALKAEGFEVPRNCCDIKVLMPVHGVVTIRFEVFPDRDDLAKLGRALARIES